MYLVLLPILGLITIKFNRYDEILEVKKKFPTDRPILEKQGRVRGNKNIFKVGLRGLTWNIAIQERKFIAFIINFGGNKTIRNR